MNDGSTALPFLNAHCCLPRLMKANSGAMVVLWEGQLATDILGLLHMHTSLWRTTAIRFLPSCAVK